jgi:DinB superfamily
MTADRRWTTALTEHAGAVGGFLDALGHVTPEAWHRPPAPRAWSPAALALHICQSYEFGRDAVSGGPGMRLLVSPWQARLAGMLVLPLMLATRRFPRGAKAPAEVTPDDADAQALTPEAAVRRLQRAADEAAAALQRAAAERPARTVTHAYFGDLPPLTVLRLLSAHTRHHTPTLTRFAPPP